MKISKPSMPTKQMKPLGLKSTPLPLGPKPSVQTRQMQPYKPLGSKSISLPVGPKPSVQTRPMKPLRPPVIPKPVAKKTPIKKRIY